MTLTLTTLRSLGSLAQVLREAAGTATRKVRNLAEARRNRRAVLNLAHFDDRMLHDIGLSRSEVVGALETPFNRDPSALLARAPVATERLARGGLRCDALAMTPCVAMPQGFAQGIA